MTNWIRGVSLGGWLVLERFITPYLFAITTCHLEGNFCYHPGQIDAPLEGHEIICDLNQCKPVMETSPFTGERDFPIDEHSLWMRFEQSNHSLEGARYLAQHYDRFVTRQDVRDLEEAGVTHMRVPLPHWMLLHDWSHTSWLYFVRLVSWCRVEGIKVWPELRTSFHHHAALQKNKTLCEKTSQEDINRTLAGLRVVLNTIRSDGLDDVVTGVGLSFWDCDLTVVREYYDRALHEIRTLLHNDTAVFIYDLFHAAQWNDGWWKDEPNTFLDSMSFQVFGEKQRELSPREHVAYACRDNKVQACCDDGDMSRMVGSWSAAYDEDPFFLLEDVMRGIAENGTAPLMDRIIPKAQQDFLRNYVEAQMVAYETAGADAWFFTNFKMEGGAFAEWDFLRGVREKWIPKLPAVNVSSESVYGSCEHIISSTDDDKSIVHEYPPPDPKHWQGPPIDYSLLKDKGSKPASDEADKDEKPASDEADDAAYDDEFDSEDNESGQSVKEPTKKKKSGGSLFTIFAFAFFGYAIKRVFFNTDKQRRNLGYDTLDSQAAVPMAV